MGAFTELTAAELAAVAALFQLGTVRATRSISAGTINSNFAIETERGRWFVRVNEHKTEHDVAWESRLVAALADRGVPTPPPIAAHDGRPYAALPAHPGKWISVFAWRPGGHLAPQAVSPDHAAKLGAALAAVHVAGLDLPASWRRTSIYDHDHLVARFSRFAGSSDRQLAPAIAVLGEEIALAEQAAAIRGAATHGIIHGDLFRDNVLWDRDRLVALLDFEQASGGSFAYDLAVCINDWAWVQGLRVDVVRGLLDGYRRVRELTASDRAALLIEARAAAARFTITRITDVYLAGVTNPEKDFRAFLARCEAWRGLALGQLSGLL
ncbi:MAG: homoserine kinase [Kofleriaceae bacterium]